MKHLAISLAVLMMVWAGNAHAESTIKQDSFNGHNLYQFCTSEKKSPADKWYERGVCDGYFRAYVDSVVITKYCIPKKGISMAQLRDIVVKYMKDNPQLRKFIGTVLIYRSLMEAFPCPK